MSDFQETLIQQARLKMLTLLKEAKGYSLNHQIVQMALDAMGIRLTADQVRAEINWLASVRCVTTIDMGSMLVAELTERGHDTAKGLLEIRGIARPVPGSGQ